MQDFDTSDLPDGDGVEISDLDQQGESSSTSPSIVLLKFVRKLPFLANTRAKNTALALLTCAIVLLFLVQPGLPGKPGQNSGTLVSASSLPVQSRAAFVEGSSPKQVIWIKISNGVQIVRQAPAGTIVWHHCKLQGWHVPPKYPRPVVIICR